MELKEMIKVMQHYADGGEVEYKRTYEHDVNFKKLLPDSVWNWEKNIYRIKELRRKESKQKVTIEKWLIKDVNNGEYFIMESSEIETYYKHYEQIKLIESYEVEL